MQGTLVNLLMALGASGYTTTKAEGFGRHGASRFGLIEGGNVRIEVLGDATRAGAILAQVSARFAESRVVAFASEVEAVPAQHFE